MLGTKVSILLNLSLTMFTFISFSLILLIFIIQPKKTFIIWIAGLGLFLISSIFLECITHGYDTPYMNFFQRLTNISANMFIAEGCMGLLNKKNSKKFSILSSLTIILLIISFLGLVPVTYSLVPYYAFLLLINLYMSIQFFKSSTKIILNNYVVGAAFLLIFLIDILNYLFIEYNIYQIIYSITASLLMLASLAYTFLVFHKSNETKLYEKEVCFDDTFNNSGIGMAISTLNLRAIHVNKSFCNIIGYSKEELENKTSRDITHPDDYEGDEEEYKKLIQGQIEYFQKEKRYVHKDGHIIYVIVNVSLTRDKKGKPLYFIVQIQDVTAYKYLQDELKKENENERILREEIELDRLRTEFFANLSHEFRTPLNVIISSNKMLYDNVLNGNYSQKENLIKYLYATKLNSNRLLRLINNILDITKIDSGFSFLNLRCCNIIEVVEDLTQLSVKYAERKNISVIFDTDTEEKFIMCDINKVDKIILNLLSNAVKFTKPEGSIEVNIYNKNEYIEIVIKDTGVGIPEERLPQIFDGFRQVDKSLTRGQEGCGIGLSLVKALVEMHKGTIEITSTFGAGTCVIITLPTGNADDFAEIAITAEMYEDKSEKIDIEFSDIYF